MTSQFMRNAIRISVKKEDLPLKNIHQFYVGIEKEEWKFDTLCDMFELLTSGQTFVFCNSRRKVDWLTDLLSKRGFTVSCHHAELDQKERDLVMREFRSGKARVLLCTGLLARGIDVHQVSLVIHYDLPTSMEEYLHRAGRAGRFGRRGASVAFVTPGNVRVTKEIEQYYGFEIEEMPMDICDLI